MTGDLVDWGGTGRRLRRIGLVALTAVVPLWVLLGSLDQGLTLRSLGEAAGLCLLVALSVEVAIVATAALRGMLAAGTRGERLAGGDVWLLPPQLLRRRGPRP